MEVAGVSLADERAIRAALKDVDVIFHLAGAESQGRDANLMAVDVRGTENLARVAADAAYARAFADAYGGAPTEQTLRFALASFVRVLVSGDSPYDRHRRGDDSGFGAAEARGEAIFSSERGACFHCHPSGSLTNDGYFKNGSYVAGGDRGRQLLTGRTGDLGGFTAFLYGFNERE